MRPVKNFNEFIESGICRKGYRIYKKEFFKIKRFNGK